MSVVDVTGKAYKILTDASNRVWSRISFWTKGSDVEMNDGNSAETNLGAIKGLTASTNVGTTGYAADMTAVKSINDNFVSNIYVNQTDGKLHKVQGGADTALNFSSINIDNLIFIGGTPINHLTPVDVTVPQDKDLLRADGHDVFRARRFLSRRP